MRLTYAERNRPFPGETVSGDATICVRCNDDLFLAIADALGHGKEAHAVAERIERFLRARCSANLIGLALELHALLRGTRGAAAGLAYLKAASGALTYVGIGNTRLQRFGGGKTALSSQPGTLGHQIRTPKVQVLQLAPGDIFVLATVGISERLTEFADASPSGTDVQTVAAHLLNRYGKDHDDASCIVVGYRNG